jgi:hypothetical protein
MTVHRICHCIRLLTFELFRRLIAHYAMQNQVARQLDNVSTGNEPGLNSSRPAVVTEYEPMISAMSPSEQCRLRLPQMLPFQQSSGHWPPSDLISEIRCLGNARHELHESINDLLRRSDSGHSQE